MTDNTNTQEHCDHHIPDPITGKSSRADDWGHTFCPKCRKKL